MPKPVLATLDEIQQLEANLKREIASARDFVTSSVTASETKLRSEIGDVSQEVKSAATAADQTSQRIAADSKSHTQSVAANLEKSLGAEFSKFDAKIKSTADTLTKNIKNVDETIRVALANELKAICDKFDQELTTMKQDFNTSVEATAKKAAQDLSAAQELLNASFESLRKETKADNDAAREASAKELEKAVEAQAKKDEEQDERSMRAQNELALKTERLGQTVESNMETVTNQAESIKSSLKKELTDFQASTEGTLVVLKGENGKIRAAVSEVENLSTRRVEWVIKNVSQRLSSNPDKCSLHSSWFSPKFDACGAHGLQLELQLFKPSDLPIGGQDAGDTAVYLWACKGMKLCYKLYVGGKSAVMEKTFNGRVPYGTSRFTWLKDQINRRDDTLHVGVEILEAVRQVEHPVKPPPLEDLLQIDEGKPLGERQKEKPLESSIWFHRHINNRMLDQVKNQVEMMNSRMIRKIEWRVENASMLRRCFPPNEPICSTAFSAAGVDGMQLVFYPSGYKGSTEGFCSLFLYCPAGCTLKCHLLIGNQKREASHSFEEPGAFGRTNFCRFEPIVDETDDSVLIVLEIEEAHQDVYATLAHPTVVAGDTRSQAQLDGTSPDKVESVVKLTKNPGKGIPGLEDVRVLPSLWTPKPIGEGGALPDGMHSFGELKSKSKGQGNSRRAHSPGSPPAGMRVSESMPSLREVSPARGEDSGGLPQLSKTDGYECIGGKQQRKRFGTGRRPRGGPASPASLFASTMPT